LHRRQVGPVQARRLLVRPGQRQRFGRRSPGLRGVATRVVARRRVTAARTRRDQDRPGGRSRGVQEAATSDLGGLHRWSVRGAALLPRLREARPPARRPIRRCGPSRVTGSAAAPTAGTTAPELPTVRLATTRLATTRLATTRLATATAERAGPARTGAARLRCGRR